MGNKYESNNDIIITKGSDIIKATRDSIINHDKNSSNEFIDKMFEEWCILRKYTSRYRHLDLDYRIARSEPIDRLSYDYINNDTFYKIEVDIYYTATEKLDKYCVCNIDSECDLEAKETAINFIINSYLDSNQPYRNADIGSVKLLYNKVGIKCINDSPYISILTNGYTIYGFYLTDVLDRIAINFNNYLD